MPRNQPCSATRAVRTGICSDRHHGAVVPPLHLSTTFKFPAFGVKGAYDYTRSGNPTRDQLGEALAALEGGTAAVVTASGMAAITLAVHLVRLGELIVASHDCYGGTHRLLTHLARRGHFEVAFLDFSDPVATRQVLARRPRLVWLETPSNPLLRITDIRAVADAAKAAGALLVVDNTFLSPVLQQPLAFGADIVVHSTTKYLNGHSDVVGGAVITADPGLGEELAWWANCLGLTGAPFDAFLTLRGVRTLHARMSVHEANAHAVAEALAAHPLVSAVYYPGLAAHPGHAVARAQQRGFGAMLSFEVEGGPAAVEAVATGLEYFTLAESLGGVESLIAHPATMTHAAMEPEARATAGITDNLLRLSVGIEAADDLVADLTRALDRAGTAAVVGVC